MGCGLKVEHTFCTILISFLNVTVSLRKKTHFHLQKDNNKIDAKIVCNENVDIECAAEVNFNACFLQSSLYLSLDSSPLLVSCKSIRSLG